MEESNVCPCGATWFGLRDTECRPVCAECGQIVGVVETHRKIQGHWVPVTESHG